VLRVAAGAVDYFRYEQDESTGGALIVSFIPKTGIIMLKSIIILKSIIGSGTGTSSSVVFEF
jgi:hypothetical protein